MRIEDLFYTDDFLNWEKIKERIVCRLVGKARNREKLRTLVHREWLDLAEIYYYMLEAKEGMSASVPVKQAFLELWGVDGQTLRDYAVCNTARLLPPSFQEMQSMMEQLLGERLPERGEGEYPLYVLTNEKRMNGAWWMCDTSTPEKIRERVGDGYYILPSSIHECIIMDGSVKLDPGDMALMVQQINQTQVHPREVLTDSVYRYTAKEGVILVATAQAYA